MADNGYATPAPAPPAPAPPATEPLPAAVGPRVSPVYPENADGDTTASDYGSIPWMTDSREAAVLWDTLWVAGEAWPGVTRITVDAKRDIEEKKAAGQDGASITDKGGSLPKFKITTLIWTSRQWHEFQRLLPLVNPNKPGGPKAPLNCFHPALEVLGVRQMYVSGIHVGEPDSQKRVKIDMEAMKWAPSPAPAKGAGSKGSNAGDTTVGFNDVEGEIPGAEEAAASPGAGFEKQGQSGDYGWDRGKL